MTAKRARPAGRARPALTTRTAAPSTTPAAIRGGAATAAPPPGSARPCAAYRGELARHRVITADGLDYVVATVDESARGRGYLSAAYPVANGYLVMLRQPLCELRSADQAAAQARHEQLVDVLADLGTAVVRARRRSAAWRQAERHVEPGDLGELGESAVDVDALVAAAGV